MLIAGLALLQACSRHDAVAAERIACARGAAPLTADCTVEADQTPAGLVLTLREADGGFRRLLATHNGIVAADGAERAVVTTAGHDAVEVRVGGVRYRLPAAIVAGVR